MITTTAAGRAWHFSHALGRPTNEHNGTTGGYRYPVDLAIAPEDIVLVLSRGLGYADGLEHADFGRIGKTTLDEEHIGDFARMEFVWPTGIALAADSRLFVTDEFRHQVVIFPSDVIYPYPEFNPEGERIGEWGQRGSKPGQMQAPSGIAFDSNDNVYIVDTGNNRLQRFSKNGEYQSGWGVAGSGNGEFHNPWGITVGADDAVYVADWGNDRVQKFSPDGEYIMSFGGDPSAGGELNHPANVAVDKYGDVYVTDWGNNRVQIYEPDGDPLAALYGDAVELSKAGAYIIRRDPETIKAFRRVKDISHMGLFSRPVGIEIDSQDRIIITDTCGRLQVYLKENSFSEPELRLQLGDG